MNDISLEQLFSSYQPELSSELDFMSKLEKRLDAVEYVKQHQAEQERRYRLSMIATFCIGFVMGVVVTALILSLPETIHLYTFGVQSVVFMFIEQNYRILSLIPSFALICFLSYNIFQILQESDFIAKRAAVSLSRL